MWRRKRKTGVFKMDDDLSRFSLTKDEIREGTTHSLQTIPNGKIIERNRSFKTTDSVLTPETELRDWVKEEEKSGKDDDDDDDEVEEEDKVGENIPPSSFDTSEDNFKSTTIFDVTTDTSSSKIALDESIASDKPDLIPKIDETFPTPDKSFSVTENEDELKPKQKPDWFIIYGDDYQPVVLTSSQYDKFQEKLRKNNSNKSKISVAVQTFNSQNGSSSIKIVYDQENQFEKLCQNHLQPSINECQRLIDDIKALECRNHVTSWENLRDCRSDVKHSTCERLNRDKHCIKLLDKIEKLKPKKGKKCLQKIIHDDDDDDEMIVIDSTSFLQSGIKIADLQCKLRDFEGEVHRLNEERLCLEMKCNQQERCTKNLQNQLESSSKIEQELRCCLQRAEQRIEKSDCVLKCIHNKMASLVSKLQDDCQVSVAELMMEEFDTLQCLLENSVCKVMKHNERYKKELKRVICHIKDLQEKLCCSEKCCQMECLRVKNLKKKLLRYQDDMQSSVTDFGCKIRNSEQELTNTREMLQELNQKCSQHEYKSKCKENVIKDLQKRLYGLEEERTRCVERLQSKHSCYKSRLKSLKEKYKERLRYLLDKQVQLCSAKNNASPEDKDKAEITLKKVEAICSEAICRMKEIQKTMKCNEQSDTELRERINEIKCSLEGVRNCCNNSSVEEALCLLGEKILDANKLAELSKIDRSCSPIRNLRPLTPQPGLCPSPCQFKKPALSIQQEITRAQEWAANIISGQASCNDQNTVKFPERCCCPFSDNRSIEAFPLCTLAGICPLCHAACKSNND